jgi:hypothetical protein
VDYILIAENMPDFIIEGFREWFERLVKFAEEEWQRPESIFQHVPQFLADALSEA